MSNDIQLSPVAALTVGPVPRMGIVVMRPDFLTHATQKPEEAHQGRTYALTPVQAQHLVEQIQKALATLETSGTPDGGTLRH